MAKKKEVSERNNGRTIEIQQVNVGLVERGNQTIQTWYNNLKNAESLIFSNRRMLYSTYKDVTIDLHLDMLMDKRIRAVRTTPFEWKDVTDEAVLENLSGPWFSELLKRIQERIFWGTTLIQVNLSPFDHLIDDVEIIPRQNVRPEKGVVMVNGYTENDATDIHYREGAYKNFILEVGRKDELGKLAMIAPYVLMKRQNLSDFSRYNEMYGIDLRVYEYDPLKPGAREESVKSAKEFGSAAYIVVPKGMAQVLFPNNTNKQASAFAFDKLHEICNNEMTLGILGQGLTTGGQNGGSYGLGKVQKTVEEEINMEDRLIAEYIINYQFKKNILLPHGYPVEKSKGSFKLQDELPKELKANMWVTLSKNGLAIAEEDFYNEFGIPFPDGRPVVVSPSPGGMPPPTPPEGEGNVPPSQPQGGAGGKKQSKLSSSLSAYYKAKCQHDKSPMRVTLSYKSELDTLIERIIKQLQTGELKPGDVDPALYNLTAEELWKGVQKGMGVTLESATGSDYGMLKALRTNVYVFSGFKNYQFIKEASSLLVDAEGKVKPFSAFRDDVLQLNSQYNVEYLRTEYNYAVSSAQMAGKWQRIQDDKGTLPMLQYITVGDARVRAAHAALDGIIKPVDDEFWNEFYPPNSWNCRCTVKQLADGEVTETKKDKLPQLAPMFKMNSGKQAVIFPATHPVYDIDPADQKSADKNFGLDIPD